MALYRDSAVVLRTYKLREADRIVVLMTRARQGPRGGQGVRRTGSKFGSRMEPGSVVEVQLTRAAASSTGSPGRDRRVAPPHPFGPVPPRTCRGTAGGGGPGGTGAEPEARLHDMLVGGLRSIEEQDPPAVVAGFYLKLLAAEGVAPELEVCRGCGESPERLFFATEAGALQCASCGGGRPVSEETLTLARAVLGGGLRAVLDLPAGAAVHDLEAFASTLLEHHIERRLRAIRVLHDG
ncbi:MAG: DNA repair protein RecO [Microthrixaceae bacterium]